MFHSGEPITRCVWSGRNKFELYDRLRRVSVNILVAKLYLNNIGNGYVRRAPSVYRTIKRRVQLLLTIAICVYAVTFIRQTNVRSFN